MPQNGRDSAISPDVQGHFKSSAATIKVNITADIPTAQLDVLGCSKINLMRMKSAWST
jgi:hypothetical protein